MSKIVGHISQVIGPVVDVHFNLEGQDADIALPSIHDALTIVRKDGRTLVVEVQQHIGEDTIVRTVSPFTANRLSLKIWLRPRKSFSQVLR